MKALQRSLAIISLLCGSNQTIAQFPYPFPPPPTTPNTPQDQIVEVRWHKETRGSDKSGTEYVDVPEGYRLCALRVQETSMQGSNSWSVQIAPGPVKQIPVTFQINSRNTALGLYAPKSSIELKLELFLLPTEYYDEMAEMLANPPERGNGRRWKAPIPSVFFYAAGVKCSDTRNYSHDVPFPIPPIYYSNQIKVYATGRMECVDDNGEDDGYVESQGQSLNGKCEDARRGVAGYFKSTDRCSFTPNGIHYTNRRYKNSSIRWIETVSCPIPKE
jgi:hypothetical protein